MSGALAALLLLTTGAPLRVGLAERVAEVAVFGRVSITAGHETADLEDPICAVRDGQLQIGARVFRSGAVVSQPDLSEITCQLRSVAARESAQRTYRGALSLHLVNQRLTVVNLVELSDYLCGVLPLEIPPGAPPAALQAQAIAARSYALARRGDGSREPYDFTVAATQAYRGTGPQTAATDEAVRTTAGVVLRSHGQVVEATYCACCGGVTCSAAEIWGENDALLAVGDRADGRLVTGWQEHDVRQLLDGPGDDWCQDGPQYRWRLELTPDELAERLAARLPRMAPRAEVGRVTSLSVSTRGQSGRVSELLVTGDRGRTTLRGGTIRTLFGWGSQGLPSTLFVIDRDGERWILRGGGYGHGVGLCQAGAIGMARAGRSAAEILNHYYQKVELSWPPGQANQLGPAP